jgi:hypothetical protein
MPTPGASRRSRAAGAGASGVDQVASNKPSGSVGGIWLEPDPSASALHPTGLMSQHR